LSRKTFGLNDVGDIRQKILSQALELFIEHGYDGFSMRKLAQPLEIAAKTIYNYFLNKDEIYLHILIKGFEQLSLAFESAIEDQENPFDRLTAAIRAYVEFGLENAHLYNLMFAWHVPKYKEYVGTHMEELAHRELVTALRNDTILMGLIRACVQSEPSIDENKIRFEMIQIWTQMHGYVAGINNTLLGYVHENPISLKDSVINRIKENAIHSLMILMDGI